MKIVKEDNKLDAIADPNDNIEVRLYLTPNKVKQVLCVDVNGETILRIGMISKDKEVLFLRNI